jgi:hypothetical protein
MPKKWINLFFEENAQRVAEMYNLTPDEKKAVFEEWSEEMFEIDHVFYRNGEKITAEGRNTALTALQHICERTLLERTGVGDRRKELALAQTGENK